MSRANTLHQNKSVSKSYHIHPAKAPTFCCTASRSLSSDEDNLLGQKVFYMLKEKGNNLCKENINNNLEALILEEIRNQLLASVVPLPVSFTSFLMFSTLAKVQFNRLETLHGKNQLQPDPVMPKLC